MQLPVCAALLCESPQLCYASKGVKVCCRPQCDLSGGRRRSLASEPDESCTFAASAVGEQLVTGRTQALEAADGVPTLVLAGLPELALVYIWCNVKSHG